MNKQGGMKSKRSSFATLQQHQEIDTIVKAKQQVSVELCEFSSSKSPVLSALRYGTWCNFTHPQSRPPTAARTWKERNPAVGLVLPNCLILLLIEDDISILHGTIS
eukprot:746273-Hanusia_phi.AAC.5